MRREKGKRLGISRQIEVRGIPDMVLSWYGDLVHLQRRGNTSYFVSPEGVAQALSKVPSASGLLPKRCLGTGFLNGARFWVVFVPPRRRTLLFVGEKEYVIPLPPLVWAGWQTQYRIFALGSPGYPTLSTPLFVAPLPNVYRDGKICWGNVTVPEAATATILEKAFQQFVEGSLFSAHLANGKSLQYTNSVMLRYEQMVNDGTTRRYPLDDLMPAECHLSWLLEGRAWK